jgi:hypothetical protein
VQVDLLAPGQLEEQVEGSLEAVHVDVQLRLACRALGKLDVVKGQCFGHISLIRRDPPVSAA